MIVSSVFMRSIGHTERAPAWVMKVGTFDALIASTARAIWPISSPRRASAMTASVSPSAMRWSTLTSEPIGRVMPSNTMNRATHTPAATPTPPKIIMVCRVALVWSVRSSEPFSTTA